MSLRLFGKAKTTPRREEPVTATSATDDVKDTLDMLQKREAHVLHLIEKEITDARALHAAGKQRARSIA